MIEPGDPSDDGEVPDEDVSSAPPVAPQVNADEISEKVRRAYDLVPAPGERWVRWYDIPYRLLRWPVESWRRKFVPWRVRHKLVQGMNFLGTFNHLERTRVEPRNDPRDNLLVPEGEHVLVGGIWVAEFFPPSMYPQLLKQLRRNGWNRDRTFGIATDASKSEQMRRARRGRGFAWSRLASVANPDSGYLGAGVRERLPDEFAFVDISAVQMGGGSLTALVAHFKLSEAGLSAVDAVWRQQHEPHLVWAGLRRPHVENRYFAGLIATQSARQRLHDAARKWLAEKCAGFFAPTELGNPVVDFCAFTEFDPRTESGTRGQGEPLRSIGVEGNHLFRNVSPQMPGAVIAQGDPLRRGNERLSNSWSVLGQLDALGSQDDRLGYGAKPYSASTLGSMLDDAVGAFLLYTATFAYAQQLKELLGEARDTARAKHRRFRPRQVEQLRRELLATSLDIPVVTRDLSRVFDRNHVQRRGLSVTAIPVEDFPNPPEEYDVIWELGSRTKKILKELKSDDAAYRDVLSTAASLGSSATETRLGRRALLVAGASLVVSLVTLLVAPGDPTLLEEVRDFLTSRS